MSVIDDHMIQLAKVPVMGSLNHLPVFRDYDSAMIGLWRLDLDGIGQLQVALDRAVEGIREYVGRQERQAIEDAAAGDA